MLLIISYWQQITEMQKRNIKQGTTTTMEKVGLCQMKSLPFDIFKKRLNRAIQEDCFGWGGIIIME